MEGLGTKATHAHIYALTQRCAPAPSYPSEPSRGQPVDTRTEGKPREVGDMAGELSLTMPAIRLDERGDPGPKKAPFSEEEKIFLVNRIEAYKSITCARPGKS